MDFSRRGIRKQQKEVVATSDKIYHKISVFAFDIIVAGVVACIVIGISLGLGAFKGMVEAAPDIQGLSVTPKGESTFVYDIEGNQTAKLVSADSNRIPVSWDMIPQDMKNAFIAIEDERFREHNGIDIQGIIRAFFDGLSSGRFNQGASTITQQLLKNNVFTDWVGQEGLAKWKRKFQEWFLAIELEKNMSKDDILLNYMNTINLGQNTLGVQAASLRYFGKSVSELTLSECACIAGITKNPSGYNPITDPEDNNDRRLLVLNNMKELGMIDQQEYDTAVADDLYSRIQLVNTKQEGTDITSYFVDALTEELLNDFLELGYNETQAYTLIYSSGLKVYSTQDPRMQEICDEVFANPDNFPPYTQILLNYALTIQKADGTLENHSQEMLTTYFKQFNAYYDRLYATEEDAKADIETYKAAVMAEGDKVLDESLNLTLQPQASVTISDQRTGHVLAMVGGRGEKTASRTLNRATDTTRQPGSCFKVVSTFAPALDSFGMTLASTINDAPFAYDNGRLVKNHWGGKYFGMYTIRNAIKDSANVVTVKTLTWITPQLGYDYLLNFGFTTLVAAEDRNGQIYTDIQQSLALGGITYGVTNLELNAAYATMANGGIYCKPVYYTKVVDSQGNVLIDHSEPQTHRVLKETTAYLLTSAMQDVVTAGTGGLTNFGTTAIAGKTGTTSDNKDVWFSGYTDYYTATTWVGYDNNAVLLNTTVASTLWNKIMGRVHEGMPWKDFTRPTGLTTATVCSVSGKLPVAGLCDATLVTEMFEEGTVPTESCDLHYRGRVCKMTGDLIANDACPFSVDGVAVLPPYEPEQVAKGSRAGNQSGGEENKYEVTVDENGNQVVKYKKCHHDAVFWTLPDCGQLLFNETLAYLMATGAYSDEQSVSIAAQYAEKAYTQYKDNGSLYYFFTQVPVADPAATPPANPDGGDGN